MNEHSQIERAQALASQMDAEIRALAVQNTPSVRAVRRRFSRQSCRAPAELAMNLTRRLVDDRDDMVVRALSWALRELVVHDPEEVQRFLDEHDQILAACVKREAANKLATGLRNP